MNSNSPRSQIFFCRNMLSEAERKFWSCPELLENLLPFLDPYSITCLAKAHEPVNSVLGKAVSKKLIKQVCHGRIKRIYNLQDGFGPQMEFMKRRMQVYYLHLSFLKIVKVISLEFFYFPGEDFLLRVGLLKLTIFLFSYGRTATF